MRLVPQEREFGLNPKVNQLVGMARAARHDLLVISDSNIRVPDSYLGDIAAHLLPQRRLRHPPHRWTGTPLAGSALDNLHSPRPSPPDGRPPARRRRAELVVGKSMALWRQDLSRWAASSRWPTFSPRTTCWATGSAGARA